MMPTPKTRRYRKILCGVDFSAQSASALRYAAALASGPSLASVDDSGCAKHGDESVVGTVDVSDGHDPLSGRNVTRTLWSDRLSARRLRARRKQNGEHDRECTGRQEAAVAACAHSASITCVRIQADKA